MKQKKVLSGKPRSRFYRFRIYQSESVLHLGCAGGCALDLAPLTCVRELNATLSNKVFDVLILEMPDVPCDDIQFFFEQLKPLCAPAARVFIETKNRMWWPFLKGHNWFSSFQWSAFIKMAGFEQITTVRGTLIPFYLPVVGWLCNSFLAKVPILDWLCVHTVFVVRPLQNCMAPATVSVIVTCKNERGNIENAVCRTPDMGAGTELIFVEGGSRDGTLEEIKRVVQAYPEKSIRWLVQDGTGKGDAVRKAFDHATGDILMILDGDLTVDPEQLPKFYQALVSGNGQFINGSRLVYPLEKDAMLPMAFVANHCFGWLVSYIIRQWVKDTLCGTKVLWKKDYQKIAQGRKSIGLHDPYGDFDLLFGAGRLTLKIIDIPIRYKARVYGQSNIQRLKDFWFLLLMCLRAWLKFKVY